MPDFLSENLPLTALLNQGQAEQSAIRRPQLRAEARPHFERRTHMDTPKRIVIPLKRNFIQSYGYREKGINYCVISHFSNKGLFTDKVANLLINDLDSSVIRKKSDESLSGLDIDKGKD